MKLLDFFNVESQVPKRQMIFTALISGLANGYLLMLINKSAEAVNKGDEITAKVIKLDPEHKKIALSIKEHLVDQNKFSRDDIVVGASKANVTMIEFFDYQCGHCSKMNPIIKDLIKDNANLKVVYRLEIH